MQYKDKNGVIHENVLIKGESAYESAQVGGYQGTEEDFYKLLGDIPKLSDIDTLKTEVNESVSELSKEISEQNRQVTQQNNIILNANSKVSNFDTLLATHTDEITKNKLDIDIERKRIDAITTLPSGSTSADAELIDARVGADGVAYSNLGNSVRSQFVNTKKSIEDITMRSANLFNKLDSSMIKNGYYINTQKGWISENPNCTCVVIPIDNTKDKFITVHKDIMSSRFIVATLNSNTFEKELPYINIEPVSEVYNHTIDVSNSNLLVIFLYHASYDTEITLEELTDKLMVQYGREYTRYEPYLIPLAFSDKLDVFDEDMYSYDEVLKNGYIPNPDNGVTDWKEITNDEARKMVNDKLDYFTMTTYTRRDWGSVYDESTNSYDYSGVGRCIESAIDRKSRCQVGVFFTSSPGANGNFVEETDRYIYFSFPKFVFNLGYNATQYPLRLINYGYSKNGKPIYNAEIDWRNTDIQNAYKLALKGFSDYLDNNSYKGFKYRDVVSQVQIRFFGKWGEGHNFQLVTEGTYELEDSATMIKMVDMYIELFPDIRLIAPTDGKSMEYVGSNYMDFQKYYFNAVNTVGKFGFFNDHIGREQSHVSLVTKWDNINPYALMRERHKEAPLTGEVYNNTDYDFNHPPLVYLVNDTKGFHFSSFRFSNFDGKDKTVNYNFPSVKSMLKKVYDMVGYRLYYIPINSFISNGKINVKLLLGNCGLTRVYDNYWNAQIIIRNASGTIIDIIDNIVDIRDILPSDEPLKPNWKKCVLVEKVVDTKSDVDYIDCTYTLRVVDKIGLAEHLYFANVNRNVNGEYPLM